MLEELWQQCVVTVVSSVKVIVGSVRVIVVLMYGKGGNEVVFAELPQQLDTLTVARDLGKVMDEVPVFTVTVAVLDGGDV